MFASCTMTKTGAPLVAYPVGEFCLTGLQARWGDHSTHPYLPACMRRILNGAGLYMPIGVDVGHGPTVGQWDEPCNVAS